MLFAALHMSANGTKRRSHLPPIFSPLSGHFGCPAGGRKFFLWGTQRKEARICSVPRPDALANASHSAGMAEGLATLPEVAPRLRSRRNCVSTRMHCERDCWLELHVWVVRDLVQGCRLEATGSHTGIC
jgi:hypothetical protein